jgi:hypothetical protein
MIEDGVESTLRLAISPELQSASGCYFDRLHGAGAEDQAYDSEVRRRLWSLSEELVELARSTKTSGEEMDRGAGYGDAHVGKPRARGLGARARVHGDVRVLTSSAGEIGSLPSTPLFNRHSRVTPNPMALPA